MSKPGKLRNEDLFAAFAAIINGQSTRKDQRLFPRKYYVLEPSPGTRTLLREKENKVVEYCREEGLASDILTYCRKEWREPFKITSEKALSAARFWIQSATAPFLLNSEPPGVRELSDQGLCFHRLPFDSVYEPSLCPLFDELMSRCSNHKAFASFLGSLFFAESDRHQYVWMHGQGGNGKGAITRLLQDLLGPSYRAEDANVSSDKFFTSGLLGMRLVVFPDSNNSGFVRSGLFKSITGGDPVRVERKNKDSFTSFLTCKLMFLSNLQPEVSGQMADRRRVILVRVEPIRAEPDPSYEAKLRAEAPYILGVCKQIYLEMCPTHGPIPVDQAETDDLVSDFDEEFDAVFEQHFELDANRVVTGKQMQDIYRSAGIREKKKIQKWKEYLERRFGVRKTRRGPDAPRVFEGIGVISKPYGN